MEIINHEFTKEITCPYCGQKDNDSWEAEDDGEIYCDECGNDFIFWRHIEVTYTTKRKEEK